MIENYPKSGFIDHLININKRDACDFDHFIFFPGMMFQSKEKWWNGAGERHFPHEGVDLCLFANTRNDKFRLDETIRVPIMYAGKIVRIMDDYLGKTVIASHQSDEKTQPPFLSIYGHVSPDENLRVGVELNEGEVFAAISEIDTQQTPLIPHLHISMARSDMLPPADQLTWAFLNKTDRSVFIDPVTVLRLNYNIMEYDESIDLSKTFCKCGQLAMVV